MASDPFPFAAFGHGLTLPAPFWRAVLFSALLLLATTAVSGGQPVKPMGSQPANTSCEAQILTAFRMLMPCSVSGHWPCQWACCSYSTYPIFCAMQR